MKTARRPLRSVVVAAALATLGGCSSGGSARGDGGGKDAPVDQGPKSYFVSGTVSATVGNDPCLTEPLALSGGSPICVVSETYTGDAGLVTFDIQSCDVTGQGPCWGLVTSPSTCPSGGLTFQFEEDPAHLNRPGLSCSYQCACTSAAPGCT